MGLGESPSLDGRRALAGAASCRAGDSDEGAGGPATSRPRRRLQIRMTAPILARQPGIGRDDGEDGQCRPARARNLRGPAGVEPLLAARGTDDPQSQGATHRLESWRRSPGAIRADAPLGAAPSNECPRRLAPGPPEFVGIGAQRSGRAGGTARGAPSRRPGERTAAVALLQPLRTGDVPDFLAQSYHRLSRAHPDDHR